MNTPVTVFGGPPLAFLVTIGLFALGGAFARLFWDAATEDYPVRRQVGFVGMSVMLAFTLAMLLWEQTRSYPGFLMGVTTLSALIGPADVLTMLRDVLVRAVGRVAGGAK